MYKYSSMNTKSFTDREIRLPVPLATVVNLLGTWPLLIGLIVAVIIIQVAKHNSNNRIAKGADDTPLAVVEK